MTPPPPETIRRKERILGVWVNRQRAVVEDAPVYYQLAATRPLDQIAMPAIRDRHQIGLDRLDLRISSHDPVSSPADYRRALIRLKEKAGLYGAEPRPIGMLSGRLFRVGMDFPANVPTGSYQVDVYLFRDGEVVSAQTTPLIISKAGVGAEVFDFANRQAPLYGLAAILLAASAGWLAAVAFRRG